MFGYDALRLPDPLSRAFRPYLPTKLGAQARGLDELEELLERALGTCHARWPRIERRDSKFLGYWAERLSGDLREALSSRQLPDLYLAWACARGDAQALEAFERELIPTIAASLASRQVPSAVVDETLQLLREKLFLVEGSRAPAIGKYRGTGPLASWARITAFRIALKLQSKGRATAPAATPASLHSRQPELEYLKKRYAPYFREAFTAALSALSVRERTLLRMHLFQQLSMQRLGRMYGVSQPTISRWLASARETLARETRVRLATRLGLDPESESLIGLLHSQLELSLKALLGDADSPPSSTS